MGEVDKQTEADGKGLFIIRNGQKVAKYEAEKWVPLLPGVVRLSLGIGASFEA